MKEAKTEEMEYYTCQEFEGDVEIIVKLIKDRDLKFKNIYGPPLGSLTLGVYLAHRLKIPLLLDEAKAGPNTLIVDDIADTGETLFLHALRIRFIITLFYKRGCLYIPNIWLREKKEKYIHFPWEA